MPGSGRGEAGPGRAVAMSGAAGRPRGMAGGPGWLLLPLLLPLLLLLLVPGGLGKPTVRQERARPGAAQQQQQHHEDGPGFQYDHEAFLGKEEARSFDQLSPEESRERLG